MHCDFKEILWSRFLKKWKIEHFCAQWKFPSIIFLEFSLWHFLSTLIKYIESSKKKGGLTCFLVKCINLPMYVFVLVKSELFKTASYSWAVLTTAVCCLYTCGHLPIIILLTVLVKERKFHMSNLYVTLHFACLLFIVISLE